MKTKAYVYHSKTNKSVEVIMAESRPEVDDILISSLTSRQIIVKDDYILKSTIATFKGAKGGFDL